MTSKISRRNLLLWLALLLALAVLSACGGNQSSPVQVVPEGDANTGRVLLRDYGCGYCHVIPGVTEADGKVGPPLENLGERQFIVGQLDNTPENLISWIKDPRAIEPATSMPDLGVTDSDAADIAAYLYTLRQTNPLTSFFQGLSRDRSRNTPAQVGQGPDNTQDDTNEAGAMIIPGAELYGRYCSECHRFSGEGMQGTYPNLITSSVVDAEDPTQLIEIVINHPGDLAYERRLNSQQLAAVISYIRSAWGNNSGVINGGQVDAQMPQPTADGTTTGTPGAGTPAATTGTPGAETPAAVEATLGAPTATPAP